MVAPRPHTPRCNSARLCRLFELASLKNGIDYLRFYAPAHKQNIACPAIPTGAEMLGL